MIYKNGMDLKWFLVCALTALSMTGPLFSQESPDPFVFLLGGRAEPVYPSDPEIGPLHVAGSGPRELDETARRLESFFTGGNADEAFFDPRALSAFRRIGGENGGPGMRNGRPERVRIGRFDIGPSGREASVPVRFFFGEGPEEAEKSGAGTLFLEYDDNGGWRIIGADFSVFDPAERSDYGQYPGKN